MKKVPSLSRCGLCMSLLVGLAAILGSGCASDEARRQAAYDRKLQRTEQLLVAAGDADSLAAAALLNIRPVNALRRLTLIESAVSKAPERPDLVWLNIRLCSDVETCNPEPLEAQLRALDPENGAAWFDSIGRAARRNDAVAVRKDLSAIALSRRFDIYWNVTVAHVTNALLKTHTLDLPTALLDSIGLVSAIAVPPYQPLVNACKGDALQDPEELSICRRVATVMRGGDTYLTDMVGIAIAKRVWPEGTPAYVDALSDMRVAHYRMETDATLSGRGFLSSGYAAKRLQLMQEKRTEQEVVLAEILNAGVSADSPSGYVDPLSGS